MQSSGTVNIVAKFKCELNVEGRMGCKASVRQS